MKYIWNKLTSLPMCGFIAQLVEQHTGDAEVTGSNPVEALIFFFQASSFQLLKLENYCDDHSSLLNEHWLEYKKNYLLSVPFILTGVQVKDLRNINFWSFITGDNINYWQSFCEYETKPLQITGKFMHKFTHNHTVPHFKTQQNQIKIMYHKSRSSIDYVCGIFSSQSKKTATGELFIFLC